MDLNSIDLLKLQTSYMKEDQTTKALCAAITPQLQQVANDLVKILLLARVDQLPEAVLDELAYELHVGYLWTGDFFKVGDASVRTDDIYQIDHSLTLSF